jgi:hypothetical protein
MSALVSDAMSDDGPGETAEADDDERVRELLDVTRAALRDDPEFRDFWDDCL